MTKATKHASSKEDARLRTTAEAVGVPQYVVLRRALDLFEAELRQHLHAYASIISPANVEPAPGHAVRGHRNNGDSPLKGRTYTKNQRCPGCGRKFAPQGLAKHQPTCKRAKR